MNRGAWNVTVIVVSMATAIRVQIHNDAVCISYSGNNLEKGMYQLIASTYG